MLGGDLGDSRRKGGGHNEVQLNAVLVAVKGLRALALAHAFSSVFLTHDFSVILFTFYTLLGSSAIFLVLQQPWVSATKTIQQDQWLQIGFYAFLLMLNFLFWNFGLKFFGPTRTLLSSDHADLVLGVIFTAFLPSKSKSLHSDKIRGAVLLVIAYLLLFWVEPSTVPESGFQTINSLPPRSFQLGFISVTETILGGICLFIAVFLNMVCDMVSKELSKKLPSDVGVKKLHAIAIPMAAAILSPFALIAYFTTDSQGSIFSFDVFSSVMLVVLFAVVAEFYVESIVIHQLGIATVVPLSLISSFIAVCFYEWTWGRGSSSASWMTFLCFFLIYGGTKMLFQKSSKSDLPLYTGSGAGRPFSIFSGAFLKMAMRQTWEGKESRRIFLYLCLNLMFMFVEMVYGFITNSLGLISDSAHMLFDCTALVIGLLASVISNWEPTPIFSFGYARVEVLSGFINGIFLIFIGFLVLLEALERFWHPQEINTDKLLLVSFLGLCVNLLGLFAFHDLHDHGDEGEHGHSHGHSHDHGHGHKEKNKEPKEGKEKKEKEHKHGHEHGHKEKKKKDEHINENKIGVFLHILADTLGSVGVIISSYFVQYWGWISADPICSFFISVMIFISVIPFLYNSAGTLLQATPVNTEVSIKDKCLPKILKLEGVVGYSNSHFWRYAKQQTVGTIHVQINGEVPEQKILSQVSKILKKKGGIKNITVEITRVN